MDIYWILSLSFAILCVPLAYYKINLLGGLYKYLPIAWWIVLYAIIGTVIPIGYIAVILLIIFVINLAFSYADFGDGLMSKVLILSNIILFPMGFGILILDETVGFFRDLGLTILDGVMTLVEFVIAIVPYVAAVVVSMIIIWAVYIKIHDRRVNRKFGRPPHY